MTRCTADFGEKEKKDVKKQIAGISISILNKPRGRKACFSWLVVASCSDRTSTVLEYPLYHYFSQAVMGYSFIPAVQKRKMSPFSKGCKYSRRILSDPSPTSVILPLSYPSASHSCLLNLSAVLEYDSASNLCGTKQGHSLILP